MTELPTLITVRYVHDVGHVLDVYEDVRHAKYLGDTITSSNNDDSDNGIVNKMKGTLVFIYLFQNNEEKIIMKLTMMTMMMMMTITMARKMQ